MGNGPAPFSDIGKRAKDLLTKDYNYDHKFVLSVPGSTPMGLTATGLKKGQIFLGDISAQYKSGRTIVDVKVDTYSNVSTKVTVHEVMPSTKAILSFDVPDHKSGKLDLQYLHPRVAIDSSIGLNPSPVLNLAAAVGGSDILLGGEVGFDTASASFTKYTAGISFNKPDLSAALMLTDKGQTLKASYVHSVNTSNTSQVVAEMTHRLNTLENSFTIGSSHVLDRYNTDLIRGLIERTLHIRFTDVFRKKKSPVYLYTMHNLYDCNLQQATSDIEIKQKHNKTKVDTHHHNSEFYISTH